MNWTGIWRLRGCENLIRKKGLTQGSLTISLGHPRPDELPVTISDMMQKVIMDEEIQAREGILTHPEGVDLMPASISLSGLEVSLVNAISRESILKQYLEPLKKNYDFIILDCMPSLGMLTVNALAASDQLIVPVQAQYLSAKGLEQLLQTVNKVKRQINPKLRIEGNDRYRGYLGYTRQQSQLRNELSEARQGTDDQR